MSTIQQQIMDVRTLLAEVSIELRMLCADRTVTRGDLRELVAKREMLYRKLDRLLSGAPGANSIDVEGIVDLRRETLLVTDEVDRYLRETI